jgi:hypothetical protein
VTDDELLSIVEMEERQCVSAQSGLLAEQRREAMQYYYGQPYGNEVEGRSQVMTTEVKDAVEGALPTLMAIFTSADEIVRFEPQNQDDDEQASTVTDYVNYLFSRTNNGFVALYCLFKDALLQKNGFVKVYWEDYVDLAREEYEGLEEMQVVMLQQDPELELIEINSYDAPGFMPQMVANGAPLPAPLLYNAVFRRSKKYGKVCIDPVPPEEVLISRETPNDINKARFVEHKTKKSISEIRKMGFQIPDDISDQYGTAGDADLERIERLKFDDSQAYKEDTGTNDPASKLVWLCEAYLKVDFDGDGIAEFRKVTKIGKTILDNVEFDSLPILGGTAIPMPHKFYGLSFHDLLKEIQLQSSTLLRNIFDNTYNANNGRYAVLDNMVNMEDLLTNRPGGIVRMKAPNAVTRLDTPILGQPAYNLLEYLQKVKQNRVGATDFPNAVDPDALNSKAAFVNAYKDAALERTNLMARILAETVVKGIFWKILELVCKHQNSPQMVKLKGKWVRIDPREWKNRFNMTVTVGLGTGNQQQTLQGAMGILQIQTEMAKMGLAGRTVTEKNFYEAGRRFAKAVFPKDADAFFTDPATLPPPQPQPDPDMLKIQLAEKKAQMGDVQKRDKMALDYILEKERMGHETALEEKAQGHEHKESVMHAGMDYIKHANDQQNAKEDRELSKQEKAEKADRRGAGMNVQEVMGGMLQGMQQMMQAMAVQQMQTTQAMQAMVEKMTETSEAATTAMSQLAKPVRVVRDQKGAMVGAVRE